MRVTPEQRLAAVDAVFAISEAVREAGEVPSGTVYAAIMAKIDLRGYGKVLAILKGAGLIEETPGHLLRWIGPHVAPAKRQGSDQDCTVDCDCDYNCNCNPQGVTNGH